MRLLASLAMVFLVAACSGSSSPAPAQGGSPAPPAPAPAGGGAASAAAGGGGGASVADAASKVTDWCALLPNDVIQKFAPGAPPASAGTYPGECGASNGTGALEFHYNTGFGTSVPSGAVNTEVVPGLAAFAYLDRPSTDEVELWVTLSADSEWGLFIDVAGHDGKDHRADAVAIAQAVLAKLQ